MVLGVLWQAMGVVPGFFQSLYTFVYIWVFPKHNGIPKWMVKVMENPIKIFKMDDLGVPLFLETPTCLYQLWIRYKKFL